MPAESSDNGSFVIKSGEGFSKEGYNFKGWNTQADGSGTKIETPTITINSSTILYAQWEEVSVKLKFYIKEDQELIAEISKTTNDNILIDIAKDGRVNLEPYKFKNEWRCVYEDGKGSEEFYREGQLFTKKVNQDVRFYAQWYDPKSKIVLRKDGAVDAAELREIDGSEVVLSKDGILYASEFIEKDNGIYFTNDTNQISSVKFNELKI